MLLLLGTHSVSFVIVFSHAATRSNAKIVPPLGGQFVSADADAVQKKSKILRTILISVISTNQEIKKSSVIKNDGIL